MFLKLREWISIVEKLCWEMLSLNPNAIHLLEANLDIICWYQLSKNSNAIHLLEKYPEYIDWEKLSDNPNAMSLFETNPDMTTSLSKRLIGLRMPVSRSGSIIQDS